MILVIDNYDSFTWTIVGYIEALGVAPTVIRNDAPSAAAAIAAADAVVISPGPGRPRDAGVSLDAVDACAVRGIPLLGICLGHQAIGEAFGAQLVRTAPVHGKTSRISHDGSGLFEGLPDAFAVTRYHSLALEPATIRDPLVISARAEDGTAQAVRHRHLPIHGVQFHPESVASEHGHALLRSFLDLVQNRDNGETAPEQRRKGRVDYT